VDALAKEGEEGRGKLRKASVSRKQAYNPGISESSNEILIKIRISTPE
jgi:hypothetical protein